MSATERLPSAAERASLIHAAWRYGDLTYALHDGQIEALDMHSRHLRVVLEIARRWGKTRLICVVAMMVCLQRAGARFLYAAPTGSMVQNFARAEFQLLALDAPDDLRPDVLSQQVRFRNGSVIVMSGCEDMHKADALRGPAADGYAVDEAGFIPVLGYVLDSVIAPQLLTTRKLWPKGSVGGHGLVVSTPPPTPDHPFCTVADKALARGAHMHRTLLQAPHLAPEEIQQYADEIGGDEESADYQREILARRVTDPKRAIVPEWNGSLVSDAESGPHVDRYVIGDLGYVDLTAVLLVEWDFAGAKVRVVDEVIRERSTSFEIQAAVRAAEIDRWGTAKVHRRIIDAPAITRADMIRLQRGEPEAQHWQPARTDELEAGVNALRGAVQRKQLTIHPRCTTTIAHVRGGIWNEQRTKFARSAGLGHFDAVAALVYACRHVDRSRNPTPALVVDNSKQWRTPYTEPVTAASKFASTLRSHGKKRA